MAESMMAATVIANARGSAEGICLDDVRKFMNAFVCTDDVKEILEWLVAQAERAEQHEALGTEFDPGKLKAFLELKGWTVLPSDADLEKSDA